jgi:DNA helicase HerA-like ATPase
MIKKGQHAIVIGQTGSGKTVCLTELVKRADYAPVFILDSKLDDAFLGCPAPNETVLIYDKGADVFAYWLKRTPARKIPDYVIIRPPVDELSNPELLDSYLFSVYTYLKSPAIFVVDELYMIHRSGRCFDGLTAMFTRGRSKGFSLYGATQRPSWVAGFCFSEPSHYFVYRLMDEKDRKRLSHIGLPNIVIDKYRYFRYCSDTNEGNIEPPLTAAKFNNQIIDNGWL